MYRLPVRQISRQLRRSLTPAGHLKSASQAQPTRNFGSRWMVPRPFAFCNEEFLSMTRVMERQMRNMERLMDDVTSSRGWVEWAPRTSLTPGIKITHNDQVFEVSIDVSRFAKSGDVELKTSNNRLVISAKDTARTDEMGCLYTQLHREVHIPQDVLQETLVANMTEGHLVVSAKVKPREKPEEKVIEIKKGKQEEGATDK